MTLMPDDYGHLIAWHPEWPEVAAAELRALARQVMANYRQLHGYTGSRRRQRKHWRYHNDAEYHAKVLAHCACYRARKRAEKESGGR